MRKLHAATGPDRTIGTKLLFCTCSTSSPTPVASICKPSGTKPWKSFAEAFHPVTTRVGYECIQTLIAGASL
jgi:hypothetical protein